LLDHGKVNILLTPKQLQIVNATENVASLLQKLNDSALRCAIVYDTEKLFIGFVDALDLVTHVLQITNWAKDVQEETYKSLEWQGQRFALETAGQLMNISFGNPFETVTPETPLKDVIEIMSRGIHRLAVVENGSIVNIISQSDLIVMLATRLTFLGSKFQKTVNDAGLVPPVNVVYSVPQDTDVIGTIKIMYDNQLSGVPLIDEYGKMTLNFSASDLLNLTASNFPWLTLSAREFLFRTHGYVKPPICARIKDTIENILLKFICYRVHRVYIIDNGFHPIGVITLTDVMKFLLAPEETDNISPQQLNPESQ
jgi:CBS domain-containing protein